MYFQIFSGITAFLISTITLLGPLDFSTGDIVFNEMFKDICTQGRSQELEMGGAKLLGEGSGAA